MVRTGALVVADQEPEPRLQLLRGVKAKVEAGVGVEPDPSPGHMQQHSQPLMLALEQC